MGSLCFMQLYIEMIVLQMDQLITHCNLFKMMKTGTRKGITKVSTDSTIRRNEVCREVSYLHTSDLLFFHLSLSPFFHSYTDDCTLQYCIHYANSPQIIQLQLKRRPASNSVTQDLKNILYFGLYGGPLLAKSSLSI